MPRYINSADVLHTLKSLLYETALNQDDLRYSEVFEDIAKNRVETWVDLMPSVDVVERKKGEWVWMGEKGDSRFMCSVCKSKENVPTIMGKPEVWWFCPNCGADMRKEIEWT